MPLDYFSGQGKILVGERDSNGNPLALRWLGNVSDFKFMPEETVKTHKESYSGLRLTDVRQTDEINVSLEMTMEQVDVDNANLLLLGATVVQGTSAVTGETLNGSTTPAVGQFLLLANQDVAALVIKDSTGTPKTLTSGTNYEANLKAGHIELLDITTGGPFVGPLTADYTRTAAVNRTKLLSAAVKEYWVRFAGVNTAVSGSPSVVVDLYRVRMSPTKEMGLITDDLAKFGVAGSVLADTTKTASSDFGQFGRMVRL